MIAQLRTCDAAGFMLSLKLIHVLIDIIHILDFLFQTKLICQPLLFVNIINIFYTYILRLCLFFIIRVLYLQIKYIPMDTPNTTEFTYIYKLRD